MSALAKLAAIGGPPLSSAPATLPPAFTGLPLPARRALETLLKEKNGFFAFESALRVFPAGTSELSYGLDEWNAPALWKTTYGSLAEGLCCFAEDVFGYQFVLGGDGVTLFDPETGDVRSVAASLEAWADEVLGDYAMLTGQPLAHEWQVAHGPLAPRDRLVARTPFVGGGAYEIENLVAVDAARGMRIRGPLAQQIHDLPDGASITFNVTE
jgi:hypothetical protein